jgi:hypothetical protein
MTITNRVGLSRNLTAAEVDANFSTLVAADATKQATLISGTNLKTINGTSMLGSGDLVISGGSGASRVFRGAVANQAAMLALSSAAVGDWCTRTDLYGQVFELTTTGFATLGNWTSMPAPTPGLVVYQDVTASRSLASTDIGKVLRNTGATNYVITVPTGFTAGQVFATYRTSSGTLTLTGSGVTVNDVSGLVSAQAANSSPVAWQFDSATVLNAF